MIWKTARDCWKLAVDGEEEDSLLKGFELAYAGRRIGGLPDRLVRGLVESGRSSLELRVRLGDAPTRPGPPSSCS